MRNFFRSLSGFGLILGILLFAASLTPSLIPRNQVVQGVLSGFAFAAGYGIGVVLRSVYRYLELPGFSSASLKVVRPVAIVACLGLMATALYHVKTWQNSIRSVMNMEPLETGYPFSVSVIAIICFAILLLISRGFILFGKMLAGKFYQRFPRRVSMVAGVALAVFLIITLTNGVLIEYTFRALDRSFQQYDALLEPDRPQPLIAERAGSINSKLD